ncbi:multidrug effflux MFS transporter [Plantibacter sp. 2H11-2]|uniref:multidrug effflux MFS transporter n=1 Tax=Plantibacter sp. 2H11-2 TaxID=3414431 RepID=UPI003CF7CB32
MTTTKPSIGDQRQVAPQLVVLLGLLAVLGPLTIDLYLPAFPQMQEALSTTPTQIQLTLSAATIGFAIGQLIVGPWSDTAGRRLPLLVATTTHVASSLAIAAAPDVTWVLVLRVVQGAGAAGGGVVAMAMIRDVAEGRQLIRGLARVALFTGIAPIVAPFLGAQLMHLFDWRGIFVVVAAYGSTMLLACVLWLPETHSPESRSRRPGRATVWGNYRALLWDRRFIGVALIGGMMVSAVFAYLSSSSFLFQQQFGMTPQVYGVVSAGNAVAFVIGTQASAVIAERTSPIMVLRVVLPAMAVAGFFLGLISRTFPGFGPVLPTMLLFFALAGACGPCLGATGLADHAARAGTAAALLGAVNFGLAGVAAPIVGALGVTTFVPLGLVMGSAMTLATLLLWLMVSRPRRTAPAR